MAGSTATIPAGFQNSDKMVKFSRKPKSVAVMIFGFLESDEELFTGSSCNSGDSYSSGDIVDEHDNVVNSCNAEENKAFWESQDQLLQATLCRSSSMESKIRQATKEALRELNLAKISCVCRRPVVEGCRNCMQREISSRLQNAGYNCGICKSKWMTSSEIPSGEHTYLEVVDNSNSKKEVKIVIELNFRAEFEMAIASDEYNRLTNRLPEVYIGKIERLQALIKILCSASKKCMKERKMHMAPWRKQKYMEAKWAGKRDRKTPPPILPPVERSEQPSRPRASMLTFDLLDNLSSLRCTAIKVL